MSSEQTPAHPPSRADVAVIGGGPAAATFAALVARRGWSVLVPDWFDRAA